VGLPPAPVIQLSFHDFLFAALKLSDFLGRHDDLVEVPLEAFDLHLSFNCLRNRPLAVALHLEDIPVHGEVIFFRRRHVDGPGGRHNDRSFVFRFLSFQFVALGGFNLGSLRFGGIVAIRLFIHGIVRRGRRIDSSRL
jgi:hypothetical protein